MDSSNQQVMIKVSSATIHKISKTSRKKLQQGSCLIYQQGGDYFIKVNNFVHNLREMTFGQVKYPQSVSYFFHQQYEAGYINILSIGKNENSDELLRQFHDTLAGYSIVRDLITQSNQQQLVKKVQQAYPDYETKQVKSKSAILKISKQFGSIVGAISGMVGKPVDKVGHVIQDKKDEIYQSKISDDAKTKWDLVKQKAASINQKLSQTMKPVNDGVKTISSKIGHSFNHSNNSFVKAVRDISKKTKDALNEGYKQAINQPETHKPLPAQSDSVMEIKVDIKPQNK